MNQAEAGVDPFNEGAKHIHKAVTIRADHEEALDFPQL
jgi:hypothetical protein